MSQPQGHWLPPRPNPDDTRPFQDENNVFLDDIEQELGVLILQRPENERQFAQDNTTFKESSRDFSRALSCQDCTSPPLLLSQLSTNAQLATDAKCPSARTAKMIPRLRST